MRAYTTQGARKSFHPLAALLFFGLALAALVPSAPARIAVTRGAAPAAPDSKPFCFFLYGDPQLNATNSTRELQQMLDRFIAAAHDGNTVKPAFALIAGDLVNDFPPNPERRKMESEAFARGLKEFKVPTHLIPGNHDVYDAATLGEYRRDHGQDYYSFVYNNSEFICLNSVTLREPQTYPAEFQKQAQWLRQTLAAARAARRDHVFVVMHHPPIESVDDKSVPMPLRHQILTLFLAYGVDAILTGHVHVNQEYDSWGGIPIYTVAGTGLFFENDPRQFGYRAFLVWSHGFRQVYVPLGKESAPPAPPRRPWLGSAGPGPVTLNWSDPTSTTGAFRYRIWRDGQPIGETQENTFTDSSAPAGVRAVYRVSALGFTGRESGKSQPLTVGGLQAGRLVPPRSEWRVWDGPPLPFNEWKKPSYSDARWRRERAPLGATVNPASPVVWFRREFAVDSTAELRGAVLRLRAGDGAVAFLNGQEVARLNVPRGWATSQTLALGPGDPATWTETPLDPALLTTDSTNTLAIQVHRAAQGATMALDAELIVVADPSALKLLRGPYLQAGGATQAVVRWRTNFPSPSRVTLGDRPDHLTRTIDGPSSTTEHIVQVTGLAPSTKYFYAIGTADDTLAGARTDYCFTTMPPRGAEKPTRIWAIGDSGMADANARAVRDAYLATVKNQPANIWLMLGDNAYDKGTDAQHQAAVFETYPKLLRNMFLYTTPGNHEYYSKNPGTNNPPYFDIFSVPTRGECGGTPSGDSAFYSFDYGNIHFISLDSEFDNLTTTSTMINWLRRDLAAARGQRWLIAFFHSPPYSKGGHDSDSMADSGVRMFNMREVALPVLEEGGVDLVLCGHSHSYERSYLLDGHYGQSDTLKPSMIQRGSTGNFQVDGPYLKPTLGLAPHEGTICLNMGSSSKLTPGPLNHPVMCRSMLEMGSVIIDVEGRWMVVRFIDSQGRLRDAFNLMKGASQNLMPKK